MVINMPKPTLKITNAELKRRQDLVLEAMKSGGVDCLVIYNAGAWFGGAGKYLTDESDAYPTGILFSADGLVQMGHGPLIDKPGVEVYEGRLNVERRQNPALPPATFAQYWMPVQMAEVIRERGYKKIGWVNLTYISAAIYKYLTENLTGVEFVDFTLQMDAIRVVRSPYEQEIWAECVYMHDDLMSGLLEYVKPGVRSSEVQKHVLKLGADMAHTEFNIVAAHSGFFSRRPAVPGTDAVFEKGDCMMALIEDAGPWGEWVEVNRPVCFGEPDPKLTKASQDLVAVQDYIASMCVPGAIPQEIFRKANEHLATLGYKQERRILAHGQSYEIVDLPFFIEGDTQPLQEGMFLAIHPECATDEFSITSADNFIVAPGGARLLTKTPRGLLSIDC